MKINAEKCPFFVEKLKIKVLPTIIYFIDGKSVHTVTGFDEFGGNEDFYIPEFVKSLNRHQMLQDSRPSGYERWLQTTSTISRPNRREALSDDSDRN
jgi:thioredoxin-like negative regulator of GroEL